MVLPAKAVTAADISYQPDNIPPPISRKENTTVVVELQTKEVIAELMSGVTYEYWTYNGTVPGPFIRVKEGDTVVIRLTHTDESDGMDMSTMSTMEHFLAGHETHSIDLHAVVGPGGGAMVMQVATGETKAFQFKATRPGLYVYHCASPHIPTHIANGQYGLILVEPKEGLPPVDREFYVVQSEFYTKGGVAEKGHQEFSLAKLKEERPEYFVFNGRVGALTGEHVLKAKTGETIRIFFGAGTFIPSSLHLIGGIFDKVYLEGDIISPPRRNVQTTLVPAGGAVMVEFKAEVPGKYLLVDHTLTRAIDRGAVAELIIEGPEQPEIFKAIQ
ncbi:MAG: nitrite reductase, copper-containing [Chloroflexi bacterium]|nr:nitrite reductase, copper-containing [Chloroflexota bacterium]